jgi:hypothetical protein
MPEPTTDPNDHFDPANRAWQRFNTSATEQLDIVTWKRDDGRPVLLSLIDLHSGDTVTLAVIDSHEVHDPHALLTLTADPVLTVHGPFDGDNAAHSHAPRMVAADPTVVGTCPVPLHHPIQGALPDTAWVTMPPDLAATVVVDPAPDGAAPVAVLLLDRHTARHALVGPFPHHQAAQAWQPTRPAGPGVDRHVLALHPVPPADPPAWLHP